MVWLPVGKGGTPGQNNACATRTFQRFINFVIQSHYVLTTTQVGGPTVLHALFKPSPGL